MVSRAVLLEGPAVDQPPEGQEAALRAKLRVVPNGLPPTGEMPIEIEYSLKDV